MQQQSMTWKNELPTTNCVHLQRVSCRAVASAQASAPFKTHQADPESPGDRKRQMGLGSMRSVPCLQGDRRYQLPRGRRGQIVQRTWLAINFVCWCFSCACCFSVRTCRRYTFQDQREAQEKAPSNP